MAASRYAKAEAAFAAACTQSERCASLPRVMKSYARFHRRQFAPETLCEERRVLLIRESFSDAVGIGHVQMSVQRFTALAISMGRALVFSACEAPDDVWAVRGRRLFKNAHPYDCTVSHLSFSEVYEGWDGVDLRWTEARRRMMRSCAAVELTLDLNDARLPALNWSSAPPCTWQEDCTDQANPDLYVPCDRDAHCPALWEVFGPEGGRPEMARAPLLALYNARRDAGTQGLARWVLALAHGTAALAAPNGSTLGIAADSDLRGALRCPFRCLAYASFRPGRELRGFIDATLGRMPADAPLLCAHARTLWVDDGRCFPNPPGCQKVDFKRLAWWHTERAISHSAQDVRDAWLQNRRGGSLTVSSTSPLWWRLEFEEPLPVCRVELRPGTRKRGGRLPEALRNVSVSLIAADGSIAWRSAALPGGTAPPGALSAAPASAVLAKAVRIERHFSEPSGSLSLAEVAVHADEPLSWPLADRGVAGVEAACKLMRWRAKCRGRPLVVQQMMGGWSGFVNCAVTSQRLHRRLLQMANTAAGATVASGEPRVYLSSDAPALLELAHRSFGRVGRLRSALGGEPVASWEPNRSRAEYLRAAADFEILRLCDALLGPVSSMYAQAAAQTSLLVRVYLSKRDVCGHAAPKQRVKGVLEDCMALKST